MIRSQEPQPFKTSSRTHTESVGEHVAVSNVTLPKMLYARHRKKELISDKPIFPAISHVRTRISQTRPKSCASRVETAASSSSTSNVITPGRSRSSLSPTADGGKRDGALSSPARSRTVGRSSSSMPLNVSSSQSVLEETSLIDLKTESSDHGIGFSSSNSLSAALLRKFEDSDKTAKKAQSLIADYKRSTQVIGRNKRFENKSLAEAIEEVKNCRYLRVVKRKDEQ